MTLAYDLDEARIAVAKVRERVELLEESERLHLLARLLGERDRPVPPYDARPYLLRQAMRLIAETFR